MRCARSAGSQRGCGYRRRRAALDDLEGAFWDVHEVDHEQSHCRRDPETAGERNSVTGVVREQLDAPNRKEEAADGLLEEDVFLLAVDPLEAAQVHNRRRASDDVEEPLRAGNTRTRPRYSHTELLPNAIR